MAISISLSIPEDLKKKLDAAHAAAVKDLPDGATLSWSAFVCSHLRDSLGNGHKAKKRTAK